MTQLHTPTRPRSTRRATGAALAVGALALFTVACGSDEKTTSTTAAVTTAAETTAPSTDEVVITGQWARTSPANVENGAAYMTITSPVDDKLLKAAVDASVAATVELHETVMSGGMGSETTMAGGMGSETTMAGGMGSETTMAGGMGSETTMAGQMTMQPVDSIDLPAGTAVELKPGGYHIMLIGLAKPLEVGTTITITLTLDKAGEITIDVPVLDEAP